MRYIMRGRFENCRHIRKVQRKKIDNLNNKFQLDPDAVCGYKFQIKFRSCGARTIFPSMRRGAATLYGSHCFSKREIVDGRISPLQDDFYSSIEILLAFSGRPEAKKSKINLNPIGNFAAPERTVSGLPTGLCLTGRAAGRRPGAHSLQKFPTLRRHSCCRVSEQKVEMFSRNSPVAA